MVRADRDDCAGPMTIGRYDYNADGLRVRHELSDRGDVEYYYDGDTVL